MNSGYQSPFEFLDECWELNEEQEERRLAVDHDIRASWPDLRFAVSPARKVLRRGKLHVPPENELFGVGYTNGPLLMDMREVIDGRCRNCSRGATVGSILWVGAQSQWRDLLNASGRIVIQPFDLTPERIRSEIAAIDDWAFEVGLADGNPSQAEGWEVVHAAGWAAKEAGKRCPLASDASIPKWDWQQPVNAIRTPK